MFNLSNKLSFKVTIGLAITCLFSIASLFSTTVNAFDFSKPTGYFNDYENILSIDEQLEATLVDFEAKTSVEIFVVTTKDFQESTIEDYSNKLFENWGIGKKNLDNGVLLVLSATQKKSRIEVGYGLEGVLNDSKTGRIQDEFLIPFVKDGDYDTGIKNTVNQIIREIVSSGEYSYSIDNIPQMKEEDEFFPLAFITLFIIVIFFSATKSWWLGGIVGFVGGVFLGNSLIPSIGMYIFPIPFALLGLLLDYILSMFGLGNIFRLLWIVSRVGFGGGSSSGGFGGGGGGRSGGGGSSRGW
jgi:uncharacterized protein